MGDELKPCPFCGGEASMVEWRRDDGEKVYFVEHANTGDDVTCLANRSAEQRDYIVESWNARPLEDALRARAEAAEAENNRLKSAILEGAAGAAVAIYDALLKGLITRTDKEIVRVIGKEIVTKIMAKAQDQDAITDIYNRAYQAAMEIMELRLRHGVCNEALEKANAELAALREANRWIPVEERLPEESGSYLFLFRHKYIYKEFYVPEWGKPYIGFTHWRYLPEPPEVSE